MSLRASTRLLTADHNCQHPSSGGRIDIATTYPADNSNNNSSSSNNNNSEDNDGWNIANFVVDNNGDVQDWTEVERRLVGPQTTLNVVGSCRQPLLLLGAPETTAKLRSSAVCVTTTAMAETATTPTGVVGDAGNAQTNAKGCAFDLGSSSAEAHRQNEETNSGSGSHLLDETVWHATRLLPVARVCPISIHGHQAAANGRPQNDLLFLSSSSAIGSPNADPIAKQLDTGDSSKRSDELDQLAEKYLDEVDKLNLAYYLNEYETNGCDLSELLTNLIRDLLAKLPNPGIKYKLLSLIKRVYIDDNNNNNCQLLEDEWKNPQLDVLLFDTMLHQYLMASSFNQISAHDYHLAERKRKRRQRRAAQLAAAASTASAAAATATSRRHHQQQHNKQLMVGCSVVVRPNRRETSPSHRRRQLRNLGPESGAADEPLSLRPASNSTTAEPPPTTTTTRPSAVAAARLDYCYGSERREFDQENESLHPLTQKLVISSTPSPSLSSLSAIQQQQQQQQQQEAISTNASGVVVVCGQSARLAAAAVAGSSSMDYSQSPEDNLSRRWHELNLLSPPLPPLSSSPTSLLAQQQQQHHNSSIADVSQPPPSNQNIYPPSESLFAKQQQQHYHLSDYLRQDQQHPSTERQEQQQLRGQFQADSALADCSSRLIPDASQQQSWPGSNKIPNYPLAALSLKLDDANQCRQSHGINSTIAFGDGLSSDWPPPTASSHLIPSGGNRPFLYHDQRQDQWHFNSRPLDLGLGHGEGGGGGVADDDEEDASFEYRPLVNNSSPVTGSRSASYQWPPAPLPSAFNQRHLAGSCSSSSTSELLWPPAAGFGPLVRQQQQICRCDQCRPLEPPQPFIVGASQNNQDPTATNWPPYHGQQPQQQQQQQHPGSQRSASVQIHHQLDPRQLEQRCFSSISVHYDEDDNNNDNNHQGQLPVTETQAQKMAMIPLQPQPQQGFVNSPPADCCSLVGNSRLQQAWPASQQQRFVQQVTYSSLPSSPVAQRHYLTHRPLPGGNVCGGRAATAACGTDGLWPGGRQDYSQPQPQPQLQPQQHRRQHHQSIQLKDWPHGNTQATVSNQQQQQQQQQQQLSADSRRSRQNDAVLGLSSLSRHQPSASATARSATIDNSSSGGSRYGYSRASNEQRQQQQYVAGAPVEEEGRGGVGAGEEEELEEEEEEDDDEFSGDECALVPLQAKGKLPLSVAEQMERQASNFVHQYGSAAGRGSRKSNLQTGGCSKKPNLLVRRTLRVKIKKSKPILGIAIEGGFNVSGQLLPRVVCVHEDGAAYQCGKLRASDLILEVNGNSTVNMTHDQIARTIATAYYQDPRPYIEFLIGESMHAA